MESPGDRWQSRHKGIMWGLETLERGQLEWLERTLEDRLWEGHQRPRSRG